MPNYTQTLCSELEYEALLNLDRMIRLAMAIPNTGEFLVGALHALDNVRTDQGLPIPEAVGTPKHIKIPTQGPGDVSALAGALIRRAMEKPKS